MGVGIEGGQPIALVSPNYGGVLPSPKLGGTENNWGVGGWDPSRV